MLKSNRLVQGAIFSTSILFFAPLLGYAQMAPEGVFASPAFVQVGWASRAFLGVGVREVDADRAKALNLKEEYGVEVLRVDEGSPAEAAGIKVGDVVLAYNGQRVEGTEQFVRFVRETPPERTVKLSVVRDGAPQTIAVPLGTRKTQSFGPSLEDLHIEMPEGSFTMPDVPRAMMSWRNSVLGVEAEALKDTQLATYFGVKDGVLVRSVANGTAAEKAGLKAGDVLLKVESDQITSPRDVTNAMREASRAGKKAIAVVLMREHKETTVSVALDDVQPSVPKPRASRVSQPRL
jgi:serine protease Do